jgi:hypothetical protein
MTFAWASFNNFRLKAVFTKSLDYLNAPTLVVQMFDVTATAASPMQAIAALANLREPLTPAERYRRHVFPSRIAFYNHRRWS